MAARDLTESDLRHRSHFVDGVFRGVKMPGETLDSKEFEDCAFVSCDLSEARLGRCRFIGCELRSSDLGLASVSGCAFRGCSFVDCRLSGVDWSGVDAALGFRVSFERCLLDGSFFGELDLSDLRMVECSGREVGFEGSTLAGACFRGTNLEGSRFQRTDLRGADLSGASGVAFDPGANRLGRTTLSLEGALGVLGVAGIVIPEMEEE